MNGPGGMVQVMDQETFINRILAQAIEEAGMAGLCRDGQRDMALDRVLRAVPDLTPETASRRVEAMLDKMAL